MRLFELMIGACSPFFVVFTLEPWAEVVRPHQSPFSVPAAQHWRARYILCSAHQAKSLVSPSLLPYCHGFHSIYLWSSLQFSVTPFTFPLDAHVHHFFSLGSFCPLPVSPSPISVSYCNVPDTQCGISPLPMTGTVCMFPFLRASLSYTFSFPLHFEVTVYWTRRQSQHV